MSTARDLRRCALQALYQFDIAGGDDHETVRESLEQSSGSPQTHQAGFDLAVKAWSNREATDAIVADLAPDWPTYRQPVIDRNILRLAHYEMTLGETPPKVAINEAVELAKEFSTEKSPMFVNGVLDKIFRALRDDVVETVVPAENEAGVETEAGSTESNEQRAMGLFKATIGAIRKGLAKTRQTLASGLRTILGGRALDDALIDEIETHLITADVGVATTNEIIGELREAYRQKTITQGDEVIGFLKDKLKTKWADVDRHIAVAETSPTVILVAGINGVGKTTSVAKIAKSLRDEGRSVLLAAADTFRAGAVEQLAIWSERLGVDIVRGKEGADPAAVVFDALDAVLARNIDVLLIDTAGRLHTQENLMRQLTKIRNVVSKRVDGAPHEVLLVLDATAGQNAVEQAKKFQQAIEVTGIFLAKLDGTAKGGIVIAIRDSLGIPVKLVGVGETPDDVEPFDPEAFIEAMFEDDGDD